MDFCLHCYGFWLDRLFSPKLTLLVIIACLWFRLRLDWLALLLSWLIKGKCAPILFITWLLLSFWLHRLGLFLLRLIFKFKCALAFIIARLRLCSWLDRLTLRLRRLIKAERTFCLLITRLAFSLWLISLAICICKFSWLERAFAFVFTRLRFSLRFHRLAYLLSRFIKVERTLFICIARLFTFSSLWSRILGSTRIIWRELALTLVIMLLWRCGWLFRLVLCRFGFFKI